MSRSLGKKLRFEVFKRDEFKCQYCGATPPAVILQVDHIHPVSDGGSNEMDNLITSCQPCNIGKGKHKLSNVPESLKQKAERIAESEAQISGYQAIIFEKSHRIEKEAWEIFHFMLGEVDSVPKKDFLTVKGFIGDIGFYEVKEAAEIAFQRFGGNSSRTFRYFCGVCINKKKAAKK